MTVNVTQDYIQNNARTEGEIKTAFAQMLAVAEETPGGAASSQLTISSGTITPPAAPSDGTGGASRFFRVDTEADAATDDLNNIAVTNVPDGGITFITPENAARVMTVKHEAGGSGEISLAGGVEFVGNDLTKVLAVRRDGTQHKEVGRFNGGDFQGALEFIRTTASRRDAAKTANYTVLPDSDPSGGDRGKLIPFDATAAARTATLPAAATAKDGFIVGIRKTDSSANAVTVDGNAAELVEGAATRDLTAELQTEWFRCTGTAWEMIGSNGGGAASAGISAQAVCVFDGTDTSPITPDYNVGFSATLTKVSSGIFTVTLSTALAAGYGVQVTAGDAEGDMNASEDTDFRTSTVFRVVVRDLNNTAADPTTVCVTVWGTPA